MVVASPVYYASANGTLVSFLDRLFFSCKCDKTMKVGAAVAVARRGGLTVTFDQLNKYFTISGMPVAGGSIGTAFTEGRPVKSCRMKRGCNKCARSQETWHF